MIEAFPAPARTTTVTDSSSFRRASSLVLGSFVVPLFAFFVTGAFGAVAPGAALALDAAPWQRVLTAHAAAEGFDYEGLREDSARRADLAAFVAAVGEMEDDEPLASWLNAYNALVVEAIVTRFPLRSVRDVDGFFDRVTHRVAGRSRTLDYLENRIIRPRFRDARIHMALNCGARSCPALSRTAFAASTLDTALDRLARAAVADREHVRIVGGGLRVSEIFFWFAADFERDGGSVVRWIKRYGGPRLAAIADDAALSRLTYDWRLNSAP